jgi:hypothetical protein
LTSGIRELASVEYFSHTFHGPVRSERPETETPLKTRILTFYSLFTINLFAVSMILRTQHKVERESETETEWLKGMAKTGKNEQFQAQHPSY